MSCIAEWCSQRMKSRHLDENSKVAHKHLCDNQAPAHQELKQEDYSHRKCHAKRADMNESHNIPSIVYIVIWWLFFWLLLYECYRVRHGQRVDGDTAARILESETAATKLALATRQELVQRSLSSKQIHREESVAVLSQILASRRRGRDEKGKDEDNPTMNTSTEAAQAEIPTHISNGSTCTSDVVLDIHVDKEDDDKDTNNYNDKEQSALPCQLRLHYPQPENDFPGKCTICLDHFSPNDVIAWAKDTHCDKEVVCNHIFHQDCLMPWLQLHNECPLCRSKLVYSVNTAPPDIETAPDDS